MNGTDVLTPLAGLDVHLQQWVADGLITPEEAHRIADAEASLAVPVPRSSLVTEALGYVGGALVVLATILLTAQFWDDLGMGVRLGVVGAAAVLLLLAGLALPAQPGSTGERLRAGTWLLSTGAATFWLGLLAIDAWNVEGAAGALLVSAGAAGYAALLWWRSHHVLQQAAMFAALVATAVSAVAQVAPHGDTGDALPGLGATAVGLLWLTLGIRDLLGPRRVTLVLGGGATIMGAAVTQGTGWGRVLALVAVASVLALALRINEITLLVVGTLGMFVVLPNVLMTWFPGAVAAPLVLLVCGSALVLVATKALRRRG